MLNQVCSTTNGPQRYVRVATALVTERGIGLKSVTLGGLADAYRVEIGALDENIGGFHSNARFLTSEDTGTAHPLFLVAYHQVAFVKFAFNAVKCDKRSVLWQTTHNDLAAFYLVGIESVQRLSHFHQYEVGDVYNIVDWAQSHGAEFVLQPVG